MMTQRKVAKYDRRGCIRSGRRRELTAMAGPVTLAVLGAGARGTTFSGFAEQFPDRARVVAVADPRADRRDALAGRLGVPAGRRFADWRELAAQGRLADAVVVTTPDREHVGPAVRFPALGYHVLLEKPMAPTRGGCVRVVAAAEQAGFILAVCHVMRYTAYTEAVHRAVAEGRLGQIVGVDHMEPVGWWHFAHAYVRGNWRRSDQSGPSLLTKCCHDLDWLRHIVGRPAVTASSQGGLRHFTAANPPGRDVADHQVVTIEFDGGVTATITMSAFTPMARRRTRIMGTRGFLEGDGTR